jgi:hypothetical protein
MKEEKHEIGQWIEFYNRERKNQALCHGLIFTEVMVINKQA